MKMDKQTELELWEASKTDPKAVQVLWTQLFGMWRLWPVKNRVTDLISIEEWESLSYIEFAKCLPRYNPSLGNRLSTFMHSSMFLHWRREVHRVRQQLNRTSVQIETSGDQEQSDCLVAFTTKPLTETFLTERLLLLVDADNELPTLAKRVVHLRLESEDELSVADLAKTLSVRPIDVKRALKTLKEFTANFCQLSVHGVV